MRRIIVAFERQSSCDKLQSLAESSGEFSCLVCRNGAQARQAAHELCTGIVVCGFKLIDESCEDIFYDLPSGCSMLMLAPQARLDLCQAEEIFKLPTPVSRARLLDCLRMISQLTHARDHAPALRTEQERQLIEQAKTLLMARYGMTEQQAHRLLQKRSMDAGARLVQTAQAVLDSW